MRSPNKSNITDQSQKTDRVVPGEIKLFALIKKLKAKNGEQNETLSNILLSDFKNV